MSKDLSWVDKQEEKAKEDRAKEYFNLVEGKNTFVMLTHAAPQALKWVGQKYEPAEEGDKNVSIKGICWVWQNKMVKLAKLPYTVVKQLRAFQNDPEWELTEFPWLNPITVVAKNAGSKEVEYQVTISPKKVALPENIGLELAQKPSPEEMVAKMKEKKEPKSISQISDEATEGAPSPDDIPF